MDVHFDWGTEMKILLKLNVSPLNYNFPLKSHYLKRLLLVEPKPVNSVEYIYIWHRFEKTQMINNYGNDFLNRLQNRNSSLHLPLKRNKEQQDSSLPHCHFHRAKEYLEIIMTCTFCGFQEILTGWYSSMQI